MDYLDNFSLNNEPFANAPINRFYYHSTQHDEALKRLTYIASTMKGLAVCIGNIGHGKTTLARRLLDHLLENDYEAAMLVIVHEGITATWLLKRIALQLGVTDPGEEKLTIINRLYQRLVEIHESGRKAVVIIDEAQMLASKEIMEEFRGLLNIELPGHKLLSFIFFGLPELEQHLLLDPPLAQRVALKYRLKPFDEANTAAYINYRMEQAGAHSEVFLPEAITLIHEASKGIPRVINTICDNALLEAFLCGSNVVTAEIIKQVSDNLGAVTITDECPLEQPQSLNTAEVVTTTIEPLPQLNVSAVPTAEIEAAAGINTAEPLSNTAANEEAVKVNNDNDINSVQDNRQEFFDDMPVTNTAAESAEAAAFLAEATGNYGAADVGTMDSEAQVVTTDLADQGYDVPLMSAEISATPDIIDYDYTAQDVDIDTRDESGDIDVSVGEEAAPDAIYQEAATDSYDDAGSDIDVSIEDETAPDAIYQETAADSYADNSGSDMYISVENEATPDAIYQETAADSYADNTISGMYIPTADEAAPDAIYQDQTPDNNAVTVVSGGMFIPMDQEIVTEEYTMPPLTETAPDTQDGLFVAMDAEEVTAVEDGLEDVVSDDFSDEPDSLEIALEESSNEETIELDTAAETMSIPLPDEPLFAPLPKKSENPDSPLMNALSCFIPDNTAPAATAPVEVVTEEASIIAENTISEAAPAPITEPEVPVVQPAATVPAPVPAEHEQPVVTTTTGKRHTSLDLSDLDALLAGIKQRH